MTHQLTTLKPERVADLIGLGRAILVDVREPDEFARRHIRGAVSRPLSRLAQAPVPAGRDVVFTCRSGMRTTANCQQLAAAVDGPAFVLEGGLDGWAAAGLPVETNAKAPVEMMRQVQIAAGMLVLVGVVLGLTVHPHFLGVSAFAGAGLILAGATGFCGMARALALMPWNRPAAA